MKWRSPGETLHANQTLNSTAFEMSLQSCDTCGYALSIADAQCRHCAGAHTASSGRTFLNGKLADPAAVAALGLAMLLYAILSR